MKNIRIYIENGLIKSVEKSDVAQIIIDGTNYSFPDSVILPGLTDSHCHVWGLGMQNSGMDISGGKSEIETLEIAKLNNFRKGDWITGRGWNNELWDDTSLPCKVSADIVFPESPIALTRVDGHSIWCNSKALEIANINAETKDPDGGKIIRDLAGNPTGLLIDNAMNLLNSVIPEFSEKQLEDFILKGLEVCLKSGLTAVHDMDVSPQMIDIYHRLNSEGRLPIRVFAFVSCQNDEAFSANIMPFKSEKFSVQGIKLFSDGALGSYGAALLEDYSDKKGESGLILLNAKQMLEKMIKASDLGFDIAVHAIGDRANREVLNAFEMLRKERPQSLSILRMEHSQIVNSDDIKRIKELNVVASIQPIHFVGDAEMALKRLGKSRLINSGYPWKTIEDAGVMIIGGSDFPIESHNPFLGIEAFINRQNNLSINDEIMKECLSEQSAIESYTINPYKSVNIDNIGKLETGFKADFTVINECAFGNKTKVLDVFIDGKLVLAI